MKFTDLFALWPLIKLFTPRELRPLLEALRKGLVGVSMTEAAAIARSQARGQAAGRAAAASNRNLRHWQGPRT